MDRSEAPDGLTGFFKALGDDNRLRILAVLRESELAVGELQRILGLGQSTLSSQLGLLRDHGLVSHRREGQKVFYSLLEPTADDPRSGILSGTLEAARRRPAYKEDLAGLRRALRVRAESSLNFFNALSEKEHPPPGQTWESLALGFACLDGPRSIVDLGCGTGKVAVSLHLAGHRVVGVDNSGARIRSARSLLKNLGTRASGSNKGGGLRFHLGDMEGTGLVGGKADLVLISQSLHHVAHPREVLRESRRLLRGGGRVLILDLAAHHEDWMRERFGDFWLGFSPASLAAWLEEAGFADVSLHRTADERTPDTMEVLIAVGTAPWRGGRKSSSDGARGGGGRKRKKA